MAFKIRKTKKKYENYLNDLYYGQDLTGGEYAYMEDKGGKRLLRQGKLGTALRKKDSIAFEVGFEEWEDN